MKEVEDQPLAGGLPMTIEITNSNEEVGHLAAPKLLIPAGKSSAQTQFKPASAGDAKLTVKLPAGFASTPELTEVVAAVRKPALGLSDRLMIGQNLQIGVDVLLGEFPPDTGLKVSIKSDDPAQLLISTSPTEVGTKSIEVTIPPNMTTAHFFLQALGGSGTVTYTATAPGFRTKVANVTLAPSGIVITPIWQGPPDEAQLFRYHTAAERNSKFVMSLSKEGPMNLIVWTARLDPVTHRCADITVEPLRAGYSIKVPVKNSNPDVGDADTEITIEGSSDHGIVRFKAKKEGTAEISIVTPKDFTPSENSTMTTGFVQK
jgi:hypothetical protein